MPVHVRVIGLQQRLVDSSIWVELGEDGIQLEEIKVVSEKELG